MRLLTTKFNKMNESKIAKLTMEYGLKCDPLNQTLEKQADVRQGFIEGFKQALNLQNVNAPLIADLETQLINATNEILKPGTIGDTWRNLDSKIKRISSTLDVLNGR